MKELQGGVVAAKGFTANGIHCGIRHNRTKRDLALILSDRRAAAACVYTTNLVQGAPIAVTKAHVADGYARAILCNSGNANTCNANGTEVATATCEALGARLGIAATDVIVASTGVIGQPLDPKPIVDGLEALVAGLGPNSAYAAEAIMTTDTVRKEVAYEFECGGVPCRIGGIAKGSGMIHPNLATMLVFITTDCAVAPDALRLALRESVADTFNMLSIDGDTSTNDMVTVLANGAAGNPTVCAGGADYEAFCAALGAVASELCRMISADGEGATRRIEVAVSGALDRDNARRIAKSVVCSSLVKAAIFGADANWGRVLCAIGYSGASVDVSKVDLDFVSAAGEIAVCRNGAGVAFDENAALRILKQSEITIRIRLGDGEGTARAYGCDLTYDYVKINADYRT